jgi:lipid-binding SYLF domain-containing protein
VGAPDGFDAGKSYITGCCCFASFGRFDFIVQQKSSDTMMKMMKTMRALLIALAAVTMFCGTAQAGWDPIDTSNSSRTIQKFRNNDPSLDRFFSRAYGYAVFSDVYKGGFMIIGGGHGKGIVYEQGEPVGQSTVTLLNVGPQLGGQSIAEIIFFKDRAALNNFMQGNFELSAQFAVVFVKSGMATNTDYSNGVAVFAMPNAGIMGEVTLGGQKFSYQSAR